MKSKVKYITLHYITDEPQENGGLNCRYGSIFWYPTFSCVRKVIFSHKKMLGKAESPLWGIFVHF